MRFDSNSYRQPISLDEQARHIVEESPGAVSGANGHNQTIAVAGQLARLGLGENQVLSWLHEFNRKCDPPWKEVELAHKASDAVKAAANAPVHDRCHSRKFTMRPKRNAAVQQVKVEEGHIPPPIQDGTRALIRTLFKPGEGVQICPASIDEDGKEHPKGSGACFSREWWLAKLDKTQGDSNSIFGSSGVQPGIYIRINPMRIAEGVGEDGDVTDFRHALIEFDSISREQQWALYQHFNLPCAAILDSGGKSIHAWVKVDAEDRPEYDERVKVLYDHFADAGYEVDIKNKNPSRLSRLPGCKRLKSRQELLALNTGPASFLDWQIWLDEQRSKPPIDFVDLMDPDKFNTAQDPNCVIGWRDGRTTRFLCKGKSAWLIGASGLGKSSLLAQFAAYWGLGKPCFGISPAPEIKADGSGGWTVGSEPRRLKSLIIQAENDDYDLAEEAQGMAQDDFIRSAKEQLRGKVIFEKLSACVGGKFLERLQQLIDGHRPDVVWIDPLLSFLGLDVSHQRDVSAFLREGLEPILEATGCVLIGNHHTGKPRREMPGALRGRAAVQRSPLEIAYDGIGSSELVNWARGVMVLEQHAGRLFKLHLCKRGPRAGATHPDGTWAEHLVWIKQAEGGRITWLPHQEANEAPPEAKLPAAPKEKKLTIPQKVAMRLNTSGFLAECKPEGEGLREICRRLSKWLTSKNSPEKIDTSKGTSEACIRAMVTNEKLVKLFDEGDPDGRYYKGPNA